MSLWTPDGEHPVDPNPSPAADPSDQTGSGEFDLDALDPEERARAEALAAELADARNRLAEVPAATVVANHAMGLYELAAIHLGQQPPQLAEASVAIDAMAGMLDATPGRLGENEAVLKEAIHQLRMAYVQLSSGSDEAKAADAADDPAD